jgi:hypothetical protein
MTTVHHAPTRTIPLRPLLKIDALLTGLMGTGLAAGSRVLGDLLGTPSTLTVPVGVFLVVLGGALWFLASRPHPSTRAVWALIVFNALWVVDSVVLVVADLLPLTTLGVAVVLAQAAVVAVFIELQYLAVRRAGSR